MLNVNSLKHPKTLYNIRMACFHVMRKGYSVDHVRNRKGNAYIAVRRVRGFLVFTDSTGKEVTTMIAKVIKREGYTL